MKKISSFLAAVALFSVTASAQNYTVTSPDGNIKAVVTLADGITYDVYHGENLVLDDCRMSMNVGGKVLGSTPKLKNTQRKSVNEVRSEEHTSELQSR